MRTSSIESATYDRTAPRKAVNLSLNAELVSRAKDLTKNPSGTVKERLVDFVRSEEARRRADDETLDQGITALDEFHERHELLSVEFPSL